MVCSVVSPQHLDSLVGGLESHIYHIIIFIAFTVVSHHHVGCLVGIYLIIYFYHLITVESYVNIFKQINKDNFI
ncbi:hypothetical protein HanRHA438_Chr11g0492291 [Helianthus annuus]|nr:hypothetical protein HanRHA438_Chr11g0492291 [Helianthus annuus]